MTQTLAYQIGAMFFLAALMILGTMTRGLFPLGWFKNVTLTLGIVTVIVGGYAAYRALPDVSNWFHFGSDETTTHAAPAATPVPIVKAPVKRTVASAGVAPTAVAPSAAATAAPPATAEVPAPVVVVIRDADTPAVTEEPVSTPVVVRNPATEPDPEGKGKKVLNSVGRFLHIVKKKDPDKKDPATN
jgi:hypothetical protein